MRITVEKSVLLDKLTPAMGTVSNKNTITSIEGVQLTTMEDGSLRLTTYDMNKGTRAFVRDVRIEEEGTIILNAQRLYQTIRVLPDDELTIETDENLNCTISSGKSSFSMAAQDGRNFPNLPELITERGFVLSAPLLKRMIAKVQHSIAEQDNRPMLCGAFFKITRESLELVSCDSYTLSIRSKKCEIQTLGREAVDEISFIVPGHALYEMVKILDDDEDATVDFYLSRKHAIVRTEDIIFFSRTIDSDYIDYHRIIPKDNDISLVIDRAALLGGLERANIIAEEKIAGSGKSYVKINVEDQLFKMTSVSANGKVYEEIDCEHEGPDLEIGFNCRYLINSVKAADGDTLRITMKTKTSAVTIEAIEKEEDSSYFYMVLPVRMNG